MYAHTLVLAARATFIELSRVVRGWMVDADLAGGESSRIGPPFIIERNKYRYGFSTYYHVVPIWFYDTFVPGYVW